MRDPAARLSFEESTVVRHLALAIEKGDFLVSALALHLVKQEFVLPFTVQPPLAVVSPRLGFVSYPDEWCDAQLFRAAQLTLRILREAVAAGYDLKDASAWNILYDGTRPVFCDLLSFVPLRHKKWWALGQFCRHFVAPLAVSRHRGLRAFRAFRAWRDGIPADVSRATLGVCRFKTRYWPLLAGVARKPLDDNVALTSKGSTTSGVAACTYLHGCLTALLSALTWMMTRLEPVRFGATQGSSWDGYTNQREHYAGDSLVRKREGVSTWIERLKPDWVADFGCNTGEFSELALQHGAYVVALDADHDSVQRIFQRIPDCRKLFPLVVDIDDLSNGRGWAGEEFKGLMHRMEKRFDVVMMLALIHHLAISAAIPLQAVATFCARCTRGWLILEVIDDSDFQLALLCRQRRRDPSEFSMQRQREAFEKVGFKLQDEIRLPPSSRSLLLLSAPL